MATSKSLASPMDKLAINDTSMKQKRVAYRSVRRLTCGCNSRSKLGWIEDAGTASDKSNHMGQTSNRKPTDQENCGSEIRVAAAELHPSPTSEICNVDCAPGRELLPFSRDTTPGVIHKSPVSMNTQEMGVGCGELITKMHSLQGCRNDKSMGANNEQETTQFGSKVSVTEPTRTSSVITTVQVCADSSGRSLKPILEPIQDAVRASIMEFLPADSHQHITNEVIITLKNDQLNVTINVNCTMFTEDMRQVTEQGLAEAMKHIVHLKP